MPKPISLAQSTENNLTVSIASYVGNGTDDTFKAADISLDGQTIILGGKLSQEQNNIKSTDLLGGGEGVVFFQGPKENYISRLPGEVTDLEVNPTTGQIAVAYGSGVAVLSPDAKAVVWSVEADTASRVSINNTGRVVALVKSNGKDKAVLYSEEGVILQEWLSDSGNRYFQDVAISQEGYGIIVISGFTQARRNLQVGFIHAVTYNGPSRWKAYDYSASQVDAVNLLADTRCNRVAFGHDGKLYVASWVNGGTGYSIFSREVGDLNKKSEAVVITDNYTNAYNTGTVAMTFFGEHDIETGALVKGQSLLTRRSKGRGNSITPDSITADESGNIFIAGKANAAIKNRDAKTINGQPVASYGAADGFLYCISPDLKERYTWTPFHLCLNAIAAVRGSTFVVGATCKPDAEQVIINPLQDQPTGTGSKAYFLMSKDEPIPTTPE